MDSITIKLVEKHQDSEVVALLNDTTLVSGTYCPDHKFGIAIVGPGTELGPPEISCILHALKDMEETLIGKTVRALVNQLFPDPTDPSTSGRKQGEEPRPSES